MGIYCQYLACRSSIVVQHSPHYPEVQDSSLANTTSTGGKTLHHGDNNSIEELRCELMWGKYCQYLACGSSIVVLHLPHYPEVQDLSPANTTSTGGKTLHHGDKNSKEGLRCELMCGKYCQYLACGSSIVVQHSSHYPEVQDSSPANTTSTGGKTQHHGDKNSKEGLRCELMCGKYCQYLACGSSIVVQHSPHHPKAQGSSLANTTSTGGKTLHHGDNNSKEGLR